MTTALAQIQEEIAALEKRLELLRTAETALLALGIKVEEGLQLPYWRVIDNLVQLDPPDKTPAKGLAAAIRGFLKEKGQMTKADLDKALSDEKWSLPKAGISGALQAMRVKGVVARSKAGKWTLK